MVAFLEERLAVIRGKMDELRGVEAYICGKFDTYRADLALACSQSAPRAPKPRPRRAVVA